MPIYVYGCRKCGAVEEHIQRFSDPPKTRCEACGGKLEKQVTSAAFHLKGGGWYRDGYASARPDAGGGDGGGSGGGEASTSASGSDSSASGGDASSSSASSGGSSKATSKKASSKTTSKKTSGKKASKATA